MKFVRGNFDPPLEVEAINKQKGKSHAFIAFKNLEDKDRFIAEVVGKKMKNKKVKVKPVKINHQALKFEKKVKTMDENAGASRKIPEPSADDIEKEMSVSIKTKVCPLLDTPYED